MEKTAFLVASEIPADNSSDQRRKRRRPIATVRENNQVGHCGLYVTSRCSFSDAPELLILSDSLTMFSSKQSRSKSTLFKRKNARKTAEALYIRYLRGETLHPESLSENSDTRDSLMQLMKKNGCRYYDPFFVPAHAFFWAFPVKDNPEKSIIFAMLFLPL
jgi:hypothetical protein